MRRKEEVKASLAVLRRAELCLVNQRQPVRLAAARSGQAHNYGRRRAKRTPAARDDREGEFLRFLSAHLTTRPVPNFPK